MDVGDIQHVLWTMVGGPRRRAAHLHAGPGRVLEENILEPDVPLGVPGPSPLLAERVVGQRLFCVIIIVIIVSIIIRASFVKNGRDSVVVKSRSRSLGAVYRCRVVV